MFEQEISMGMFSLSIFAALILFLSVYSYIVYKGSVIAKKNRWSPAQERAYSDSRSIGACSLISYASLFSVLALSGWSCVSNELVIGSVQEGSRADKVGLTKGDKVLSSSSMINLQDGRTPLFNPINSDGRNKIILNIKNAQGVESVKEITAFDTSPTNLLSHGITWEKTWHPYNSYSEVFISTNKTIYELFKTNSQFLLSVFNLDHMSSNSLGSLDFDTPLHKSVIVFLSCTFLLPVCCMAYFLIFFTTRLGKKLSSCFEVPGVRVPVRVSSKD